MTGLSDTDVRLDGNWQLTRAADGDAPLCSGPECLYQNILLEAETQPGDLFYDPDFGWGLYDFIQSEDGQLTRLELAQRARAKLLRREVVLPESIRVDVNCDGDVFTLSCSFQFQGEDQGRELNVVVSAVGVEVTAA